MPIVFIKTNIEASKIPSTLHTDLVKVLAEELRVPEKNVVILVETDLQMTKEGANVHWSCHQSFISSSSFVVRYFKHSSRFIYYNRELVNPALDFDEDLE
ncbi:hypothetical protein Btru_046679 [Bulinus truncatus]|nr:hypothetical protein Btru_046679 [Bulinus truncatus]